MNLYLVQHAKAFSSDEDPERRITDEGREETLKTVKVLKAMNPDIHVIWHSGKKRAMETAEILGEKLDRGNRIMEHSNLGPNDPVNPACTLLNESGKDIMIVGHLPYITNIASKLLTGSEEGTVIKFINSGIVCLERSENTWLVKWMITPEMTDNT